MNQLEMVMLERLLCQDFDSVTTVQGLTFSQDAEGSFAIPTGSDNGWYNYNPQTFTITPIPGKVLVLEQEIAGMPMHLKLLLRLRFI